LITGLAIVLALTGGSGTLLAATSTELKLYWEPGREDNFSTATAQGEADALAAGYYFVRTEAYLFPSSQPGTVPLNQYWSAARGDNFVTATPQGEADALAAGYSFVRVEGYVYPSPQPNTVPLKLFWSGGRGDNFTTATAQGEADALAAGYYFARIEGYVSAKPVSIDIDLDSDLGAGHYMTTHGVMLQTGHIDAQTRTQTVTWLGGFTGGVQIFFEDANGFTIGASQIHTFSVDGRLIGNSDRTDYWPEEIDPGVAARTTALHVQHFWAPQYQTFANLVNTAVTLGRPVVDLIKDIQSSGGDAK
jgi:hypothetical protein